MLFDFKTSGKNLTVVDILEVSSLSCYECSSDNKKCAFIANATVEVCSKETDVCFVTASYIRDNTTKPFGEEPLFFEKKCHTPSSDAINDCNLDDPEYGPCKKVDETHIKCSSCCTEDNCNVKIATLKGYPEPSVKPDHGNNSMKQKASLFMVILSTLVLFIAIY